MAAKARTLAKKLNLSELDAACLDGNVKAVKKILEESKNLRVSTTKKNPKLSRELSREDAYHSAHLPIHTACQSREAPREIIQLLLSSGDYSITDETVSGDSALHVACTSGNLEAVEALLSFSDKGSIMRSLKHQNKDGNTPFHLASHSLNPSIMSSLLQQLLLAESTEIIGMANKQYESSLGIAIKNKDWESANLLLRYSYNNPASLYSDFITQVPECGLIKSLQAFEHTPIDVFVLGDSESGKTTLISTLQQAAQSTLERFTSMIYGGRVLPSVLKVGIVPSTVEYRRQDHKCPVMLYDVNGSRTYAHEAIFMCSTNPLDALYIITVDMRKKNIEENVLYWLCFLYHQLTDYKNLVQESPIRNRKKLKVLVAGIFHDLVPSQAQNRTDFLSIVRKNEEIASNFSWCGEYSLNARKNNSQNMSQVISTILDQCKYVLDPHSSLLNESRNLLSHAYLLASLLLKEFSKNFVITFNDVIGLINRRDSPTYRMLPRKDDEIEKLCLQLTRFNHFKILTFKVRSKKVNYIILDYKRLLKTVENALTVLAQYSNHGIVTRSQIQDVFAHFDSYPTEFIIKLLEHLKLSEHVSSKGLQDMTESIRSSRKSVSSRTSRTSRTSITSPKIEISMEIHTQQQIEFQLTPQQRRSHRRTKSDSTIIDTDESKTDNGRDSTAHLTQLMSSTSGEKRNLSLSVSKLPNRHHTSRTSSKQSSVYSSRQSSVYSSRQSSVRSSRNSSRRSSIKSTFSQRPEIPHYFLPSLVPQSQPHELWDDDNGMYPYGFAWSLLPHEEDMWFFSPKFITVVLFRLLFSFAPHSANSKSFMERKCKLWSRGILWSDPLAAAHVCVAISNDNTITLSMRCLKDQEITSLSIRNEIIADIKEQMELIHPDINLQEVFIPYDGVNVFPVIHPLESYAVYDKEEIKDAILEQRPAICCMKKKQHTKLDSLLYFEPLCFLPLLLLTELFDSDRKDNQITDDFCMEFAKNLSGKWKYLAEHLNTVLKKYYIDSLKVTEDHTQNRAPHEIAMEMLTHLRDIDHGEGKERVDTFGGFRRSLLEISVFTEKEVINNFCIK